VKKTTGRSTYSRKKKGRRRDTYGVWQNGWRLSSEIIAGRALTYTPGKFEER